MEFKFSADLPRVRRSPLAPRDQILLMGGHLFEDNRPRLIVHDDMSDTFFAECEKAIIKMDKADDDYAEMQRKIKLIQDLMGRHSPPYWDAAPRHG